MHIAGMISALILIVSGLVHRVMMRAHRSEAGKAVGWFSLRGWFVPWSSVDYLTPVGLKLHLASLSCIMLGIFLYIWIASLR